jgi:four helix bundle protein
MELEETIYWFELVSDTEIMPADRLQPLRVEADELAAILVASLRTAKSKRVRKNGE